MSDKIQVTERIYVDQPIAGTKGSYRVLVHMPGEEITAERAAEIGVTKGGKKSKTAKATKADEDTSEGDTSTASGDDVQTAEVRKGKPGTTTKKS